MNRLVLLGVIVLALAMGVIFIYLILAAQFRSFTLPVTIMMALPLAFVGVFAALWLFVRSVRVGPARTFCDFTLLIFVAASFNTYLMVMALMFYCGFLLKLAMDEKRGCYLMLFSTEVATLEITADTGLDKAERFLSMSFHGGTDLVPCLEQALVQLDQPDFARADVLVISDRALTGEAARAALFKQNPILASTPAAKAGRVLELDPTLLVGGLGPRLPQSLDTLSAGFYPAEPAKTAAAQ